MSVIYFGNSSRFALMTLLAIASLGSQCRDRDEAAVARRTSTTVTPPDVSSPVEVTDVPAPPAPVRTVILDHLLAAAFDVHSEVLVHVPESFTGHGPLNIVVYLHGWNNCIRVTAGNEDGSCSDGAAIRTGMDVVRQFDIAARDAILLIPQLAFDQATVRAGRLETQDGFRRMLEEVLARPEVTTTLGSPRTLAEIGRVTLFAHSAAYVPAAAMLARGGVDIHDVFLLDALYRNLPPFANWAHAHARELLPDVPAYRHFAIIYTDSEGTGANSRALINDLSMNVPPLLQERTVWSNRTAAPPLAQDLSKPIVLQRTETPHVLIPRSFLAQLLIASGLPGLPSRSSPQASAEDEGPTEGMSAP